MHRLLALLVLVTAVGCDSSSDSDSDEGIRGDVVVGFVDGQNEFAIPAQVLLQTTEDYSCSNVSLDFATDARTGALQIEVKGVVVPEVCTGALGPATSRVALPGGVGPGFEISVFGGSVVAKTYVLVASSGRYRLERS